MFMNNTSQIKQNQQQNSSETVNGLIPGKSATVQYTKTEKLIIKLIKRMNKTKGPDHVRIERAWIADKVGCDPRTVDRANAKFKKHNTFNMKYGWEFGKRVWCNRLNKTVRDRCIHYTYKTISKTQNVATNTICNKPKGLFNKIETALKKPGFIYLKINDMEREEVRKDPYFEKFTLDRQWLDLYNKPNVIMLLEKGRRLIKAKKGRIRALWSEFVRWHESCKNIILNLEKAWIGYVLRAKRNKVFYFPVYKIKTKSYGVKHAA